MTEAAPAAMLARHRVVEGHRDVCEQVHRTLMGDKLPLTEAVIPRLIRDRIDLSVHAIGGDSHAHSQNTGRYLETTLENIDQFLQEITAPGSRYSLVKTRGDLPTAITPDHVRFILHLEGGLRDGHSPLAEPPVVAGFEEIEDLPNLVAGLQRHGYSEDDIAAILGGNYLRVLGTILPESPVL